MPGLQEALLRAASNLHSFTTHNRILAAAAAEAGTLVWERG
jgi:hypothetical protein